MKGSGISKVVMLMRKQDKHYQVIKTNLQALSQAGIKGKYLTLPNNMDINDLLCKTSDAVTDLHSQLAGNQEVYHG